ncbi:adenylate cyclase type 10-like [Phymastichus coffea]|uniref:adenylate cyclase type 10-like n=1 Tax=Phymastichus coffea TaxID=108790 RepID=UPI00273AF6A3|nr:adenylate cyclase type 10-like [Phymastichus coffea]
MKLGSNPSIFNRPLCSATSAGHSIGRAILPEALLGLQKMTKDSKKEEMSSSVSIVKDLEEAANAEVSITEMRRVPQMESLRVEKQVKIFASMCPDEILDHYDNYNTRSYHTTLMLGDVSGFTEMTDKYTKSGKGGPSKLTETLNSYIGAMVQEILSHGGDVLKFSGDAFIVMWKLENGRVMRDITSEAIKTACVIQKHFGTYETDVDVVLKVKLAIASGKTYFTSIGSPDVASYYVITGKPVWEVKFAEGLCRGGDILVAPSCWQWVNPSEYIYESLTDGVHTLIISMSVLWDTAKGSFSEAAVSSDSSSGDVALRTSSTDSADSGLLSRDSARHRALATKRSEATADYMLRPKVSKAVEAKLTHELRSYVLRPVIRSVELDEPLEYLTEIRQVVIVFVNVVIQEINRKTLIKLVNASYSYVCSCVGEMQGCVNKTSLFDKDLMFLCIFGLRGDKHELESQIGLRCAFKLRHGLVKFQNVKSVSVGVTTGQTYCGVVGHVLRREYTVIGIAVNKAARLMCAYVNKVVCDRESFLLSHLEAKHFVLQEAKHLKGITSAGPIYEFSEKVTSFENELQVSEYPLLGRDAELRVFCGLLDRMLAGDAGCKKNLLIVKGVQRIGKTRLLEEMTSITPEHVPVNFISLVPMDKQQPCILLRLLFFTPLDITEESSLKEKQDKLMAHFNEKDCRQLSCLNHVFHVKFKGAHDTAQPDTGARSKILKKLIGKLTRSCFQRLWLILIDDAELADDESMGLLHSVVKQENAMFVLSYGNKLSMEYDIPSALSNKAETIELAALDKWYHAALACQVMGVVAIPAELEKALQERSSGNSGWIESYLVTLLQSARIVIQSMTKSEIKQTGLVTPLRSMLKRVLGPSRIAAEAPSTDLHSSWAMYKSSFRVGSAFSRLTPCDDSRFARARGHFSLLQESAVINESEEKDETSLKVCALTDSFVLEDTDSEATMDTILLKLYDSLTPLDQFLLKCAAVLGEIIDRKMLVRLMHEFSQRDIGVALVKLFELRIIGCAVGDFSRSSGPQTLFKRVHDPMQTTMQIRCGCKGIEISEELSDLPSYASCGLMRFKLDMFRKTTYRLLTDNQKVEFHSKALHYLRHNTRRCAPCGGGPFDRLLGESALAESVAKKPSEPASDGEDSDQHALADNGRASAGADRTSVSSGGGSSLSLFRMCRPLAKSPTRTFSDLDFADCQCNLHLLTAYTHILEHCRGIGDKSLLLVTVLEFTQVCLSTLNIPQATELLAEGDALIDAIYTSEDDALIVVPYLKGKIQTLRGRCFLESGLIVEAMECFEETVRIMKYKLPANPLMIRLKSMYLLEQQRLMLTCLRGAMLGVVDGDAANYNDQFASCLAHMFVVYRLSNMQQHARLVAIWALNVALESSKDFFVLSSAYANMIITAHNYQYTSIIPCLERDAINLCHARRDSVDLEELKAVAELYARIFFSRWTRTETSRAASVGFVTARLTLATRSTALRLFVLPRLVQLLVMERRYGEVVSFLQELEFISPNDMDQSGRTWYCALSVDLLLESGISVISLNECEQFFQQQSSKIMRLRDSEAAKRFFTCMWLWYVRMGNWEAATVWRGREVDQTVLDEFTVPAAITIIKKVEGLIISYVYNVDNKNIKDAAATIADIKKTFVVIERFRRVVKIITPRYYLMRAYFDMVRFRRKSGMALLYRSRAEALKIGCTKVQNWCNHTEKAWNGTLSPIQADFWKEQCTAEKQVNWHEIDMQHRKILPYTLPLPKEEF